MTPLEVVERPKKEGEPPPPEEPPTDAGGGGEEPAPEQYVTGFLVVLRDDGKFYAIMDLANLAFHMDRPTHMNEVYRACAEVMKDVHNIQAAQVLIGMQERHRQMTAEARTNSAIAQQLGDLTKPPSGQN